ncbi:aldo/keto reductase [Henriciella mobilis]|uniref:aldo/keto reductase n=1 Tax=Henriciella mobilis TaxID=2305467 RepID=UPI0022773F08|nr:aldo/keto reductase [Henriciella mobilis]
MEWGGALCITALISSCERAKWNRLTAIQVKYSAAARDVERELLPMAEALSLGVLAWGPLAGGALANAAQPKRREKAKIPPAIQQVAEKLAAISERAGMSSVQLALAWLREKPNVPVPIIGARTAEQMHQVLGASAMNLSKDIVEQIDDIVDIKLGYPHDLISSSYLQRFAFGDPEKILK